MNIKIWEEELIEKLDKSSNKRHLLKILNENYEQERYNLLDEREHAIKTKNEVDIEIANEDIAILNEKISILYTLQEEVIYG